MTISVLKLWSALIHKATREGWTAERLDAEMARVGR